MKLEKPHYFIHHHDDRYYDHWTIWIRTVGPLRRSYVRSAHPCTHLEPSGNNYVHTYCTTLHTRTMNTRNTPSAPEAMEDGRPLSTRFNGSFIGPRTEWTRMQGFPLPVYCHVDFRSCHRHFLCWPGHSTTESCLPSYPVLLVLPVYQNWSKASVGRCWYWISHQETPVLAWKRRYVCMPVVGLVSPYPGVARLLNLSTVLCYFSSDIEGPSHKSVHWCLCSCTKQMFKNVLAVTYPFQWTSPPRSAFWVLSLWNESPGMDVW